MSINDEGQNSGDRIEVNQWDFMLVIAPLRVPGGTGSPVNPLAIF